MKLKIYVKDISENQVSLRLTRIDNKMEGLKDVDLQKGQELTIDFDNYIEPFKVK